MKITNITNQLPKHRSKKPQRRRLEDITTVVFHHSAVSNGTIRGHARFHTSDARKNDKGQWLGRGWSVIGYTFYIDRLGNVMQTNDLQSISPHTGKQQGNKEAIGVLIEGNFDNAIPAPVQIEAAIQLKSLLDDTFGRRLQLKWHKDYKPTSCPGALFPIAEFNRLENKLYESANTAVATGHFASEGSVDYPATDEKPSESEAQEETEKETHNETEKGNVAGQNNNGCLQASRASVLAFFLLATLLFYGIKVFAQF